MHALKTGISPNHDDRKMKTRRANKNKRTRMQITDQENEDASSEPKTDKSSVTSKVETPSSSGESSSRCFGSLDTLVTVRGLPVRSGLAFRARNKSAGFFPPRPRPEPSDPRRSSRRRGRSSRPEGGGGGGGGIVVAESCEAAIAGERARMST